MHEPGQRRRNALGARFGRLSRTAKTVAVAVVVILLAVAGFTLASASGPATPSRAGADAAGPAIVKPALAPPQRELGPVLLVPGYGGETSSLGALASRIRAEGRRAIVLQLPGTGTGSLVTDAAVLNSAVAQAVRGGAPSVDVIGYSAGGVVALLWARHDDGVKLARRIVTLGAPFHGTDLAAAAQALVPADCPAACRQLVPGSALLAGLDVARGAGLPPWLSLWTADDQVVTPPDSARLGGAIDVTVQSVCPALAVSHTDMPSNPAVINMVLGAIGRSPLARPASAVCN